MFGPTIGHLNLLLILNPQPRRDRTHLPNCSKGPGMSTPSFNQFSLFLLCLCSSANGRWIRVQKSACSVFEQLCCCCCCFLLFSKWRADSSAHSLVAVDFAAAALYPERSAEITSSLFFASSPSSTNPLEP